MRSGLLQRQCACGESVGISGQCDEGHKQRLSVQQSASELERSASRPGRGAELPSVVHDVIRSSGQPLDADSRAFMEPRLGHSFADVRVHTNAQAAASARAVGARAYTFGNNVVFNAGEFAPQTKTGRRLLAHELTHVVQQQSGGSGAGGKSTAAVASLEHEHEAGRVADAVASTNRAQSPAVRTGTVLAMQPEDERPVPPGTFFVPISTARAERELEVEAVEVGGKSYVLYQKEVRSGGSSAWLANNPGNMDYTENTKNWGAYEGKGLQWGKHRFAIFPSEAIGLAAVRSFLRMYQGLRDIRLMMSMFAPAGDVKNDPKGYAARVSDALKLPVTTLVKDMNDDQIATFALAIKDVEGWKPGTSVPRGDASLPEQVRQRT